MESTPREVFQRVQQGWLDHPTALSGDESAEDVAVETPSPRPVTGRGSRAAGHVLPDLCQPPASAQTCRRCPRILTRSDAARWGWARGQRTHLSM